MKNQIRQNLALILLWIGLDGVRAEEAFPRELTEFEAISTNPVFEAEGPGHWDERIRERGFILHENGEFRLWYTGYVRKEVGSMLLGYAHSKDGIHWKRNSNRPIIQEGWVEDVCVVHVGNIYWMFAEGEGDRAQLWKSPDGLVWEHVGRIDVRMADGMPISPGPYGTPTVLKEGEVWNLFYERRDQGVWWAQSQDMKVWTHVQDEPVLSPGPAAWDGAMIAVNQVFPYKGHYYAVYHGLGRDSKSWGTGLARSTDLRKWEKYAKNPLLPRESNKSSGQIVFVEGVPRLYTTHAKVDLHLPAEMPSK